MRSWVRRHYSLVSAIMLTLVVVVLILLLAWGITSANLRLTMLVGGALAFTIVIVGTSSVMPDNLRSQTMERALRLASRTQSVMRGGLTAQNCYQVCQLLLPETQADAIAMTDTQVTLAHVGEPFIHSVLGESISSPTLQVIKSGHMQTFSNIYQDEWISGGAEEDGLNDDPSEGLDGQQDATHAAISFDSIALFNVSTIPEDRPAQPAGIIVPLIVANTVVGTIKFYFNNGRRIDRTQLTLARGFSELLAAELATYELDRQAELTAQAEVKALQAQINPHFLFNALNTIASFTRIDPTKARNLLREFASFYRYTLQSSRSPVPLSSELEQIRRYLQIEKARFGEDRIIEIESIEAGCENVHIPGFLIQPIVENSVRHGLRDEGPLHIEISATTEGDDVLITVADDGLGMSEEVANRLRNAAQGIEIPDESATEGNSGSTGSEPQSRGNGIALSNVANRVEHFFGVGSGVDVISRPGEGTVVTLRLVDAAPFDSVED